MEISTKRSFLWALQAYLMSISGLYELKRWSVSMVITVHFAIYRLVNSYKVMFSALSTDISL